MLEKYKDVESKQLLWELIKMELRAKTMSYSKKKRAVVKKTGDCPSTQFR